MIINRSKLKFHETFQPEVNYIAKVLSLASNNFTGSKFDVSEVTGIPTGMQKGKVEPSIKYANYMGLINYSYNKGEYSLELTSIGKEVFQQDKYLHESLTIWLCHYFITHTKYGAPQWSYLVHSGHLGFINEESSDFFHAQALKTLSVDISFEELFGVVRRSYMDGFFNSLDFIDWTTCIKFKEITENQELTYLYAYAILNSWDSVLPDNIEITILDLQNTIGFGKIFGLNDEEIEFVLESLSEEGIISVNRQLYPPTIIRTYQTSALIPLLYSKLL